MKAKYRWLFLPPALGLILVLGPLRPSNGTATEAASQSAAEAASQSAAEAASDSDELHDPGAGPAEPRPATRTGVNLPELPELWQIVSALGGVLLLGVAGIWILGRLRGRVAGPSGSAVTVRQSVRITPRHTVHAVQFNDDLLLLATSDAGVQLLRAAAAPEAADDDRELARRREVDNAGAVLRDTLIPRPPAGAVRRPDAAALSSFRTLLKRAHAGEAR